MPGFIMYTDGSATTETLNGVAGTVVTEGDPANTTTLLPKQQRGAAIPSLYDEEKEWLLLSLEAAAISTGNQPLLKAIQS